jgi:antitoxin YobK
MSMQDLERGLELVAANSDRARFIGPRDPGLVAAAEEALGVSFPPTYRRFVSELGAGSLRGREFYGITREEFVPTVPNGIGLTLDERESSGLPERYVIVGDTGSGDWYVIDTDEASADGENPVYVVMPGVDPEDAPPERVADDFGAFFGGRLAEAVN